MYREKCITKEKKIKNRLGDILLEKGMSQREFARVTGLRQATVNQLANNKNERIHLGHLLVICHYLDIDFNTFFEVVENDCNKDDP